MGWGRGSGSLVLWLSGCLAHREGVQRINLGIRIDLLGWYRILVLSLSLKHGLSHAYTLFHLRSHLRHPLRFDDNLPIHSGLWRLRSLHDRTGRRIRTVLLVLRDGIHRALLINNHRHFPPWGRGGAPAPLSLFVGAFGLTISPEKNTKIFSVGEGGRSSPARAVTSPSNAQIGRAHV